MPIEVKSGATIDTLTVDPTSKAARVTQYKSDGAELFKTPTGSYFLPIPNQRLTAAIAVNSAIYAFRNGASKVIKIKRIYLICGFDGTAAATTSCYQLQRFSAATPSGGTALTAIKKKTTLGASTIVDARYNYAAALTVTGITFETSFVETGCARQVNAVQILQMCAGPETQESIIELQPNEGLAIRLGVAAVIGDNIGGYIEWEEV